MSQLPVSVEAGVQLKVLLVCHAGAVTSGVQGVVPERRRKKANRVVDGVPPVAVAVQVMGCPGG